MSRQPGPVKGGSTIIAFVDDPTGYKWELIERPGPIVEPIAQVRGRWLGEGRWAGRRRGWTDGAGERNGRAPPAGVRAVCRPPLLPHPTLPTLQPPLPPPLHTHTNFSRSCCG